MAALFGSLSRSSAPVDESMNSSSQGMKGRSMWLEPVAMITFSASIPTVPSAVSTVHLLAPSKVAQPLTNSAPAPLSSASTPLFRRSTIESFHDTIAAMSTPGSPSTEIPM